MSYELWLLLIQKLNVALEEGAHILAPEFLLGPQSPQALPPFPVLGPLSRKPYELRTPFMKHLQKPGDHTSDRFTFKRGKGLYYCRFDKDPA